MKMLNEAPQYLFQIVGTDLLEWARLVFYYYSKYCEIENLCFQELLAVGVVYSIIQENLRGLEKVGDFNTNQTVQNSANSKKTFWRKQNKIIKTHI